MSYNASNKRQNWLPAYVRRIADALGLENWGFQFNFDSPEQKDAAASIEPIFGRNLAIIRLGDAFWLYSDKEQRATVVHELLHCHHAQPQHWVRSQMKFIVHEAYILMHENAIDAVAQAIALHFPLPPDLDAPATPAIPASEAQT